MKFIIIRGLSTCILLLFSISCSSQAEGKFSLGVSLDYGFGKEFNNKASTLRFNYNIFERSRIAPSFSYYLNKNDEKMIAFSVNHNYIFSEELAESIFPAIKNQGIRFYSITGILISSISEINGKCSNCYINEPSLAPGYVYNFGFDIGVGVEYEIPTLLPLLRNMDVNFEVIYQLMDNYSRPLISFGLLYNLE